MSGLNSYSQCALCGLNILSGQFHVCQAKDRLDGSLLESVVPGRLESPMLLNPGRSRDALERIRDEIDVLMNNIPHFGYTYGMLVAIRSSISSEIERQHSTQHEAE